MTTQTEALKLALEALEFAQDNLRDHGDNCFLHDEGEYNRCFCGKDSLSDHLQSVVEKLEAKLAQQSNEQEPVKFVTPLMEQQMFDEWCPYKGILPLHPRVVWAGAVEAVNDLLLGNATPPQRKPLTRGQIREIEVDVSLNQSFDYITPAEQLCRAIEAAHGIKE